MCKLIEHLNSLSDYSNLCIILNVGSSDSESSSSTSSDSSSSSQSSFDSGIHDSVNLFFESDIVPVCGNNEPSIVEDSSGFSSGASEPGITNIIHFESHRMFKEFGVMQLLNIFY